MKPLKSKTRATERKERKNKFIEGVKGCCVSLNSYLNKSGEVAVSITV